MTTGGGDLRMTFESVVYSYKVNELLTMLISLVIEIFSSVEKRYRRNIKD